MRGTWIVFALAVVLLGGIAAGQGPQRTNVDPSVMYCSGIATSEPLHGGGNIISGEDSNALVGFALNDLVYINRSAARVGDEYLVVRPVSDLLEEPWFQSQPQLMRAMGQVWADLGRIRVVHSDAKVSTARVVSSCSFMQRGDILLPFVERPGPPLKLDGLQVDPFAPVSGKTGMIVTTKTFNEAAGVGSVVYVNLGSSQGVRVGSYLRVFREQGRREELAYNTPGYVDQLYGFGSSPERYTWEGLPREIEGEGIVVRTSGNAASLLITAVRREIYVGDYVEIER